MVFMTSGCLKKEVTIVRTNCPPFPEPTKEVLLDIINSRSNRVDNWMKELYIYKKQTEITNKKVENEQ